MIHIGVIGIGSNARGDGAIGIEVARRLQDEALEGVDVDVISGEGMTLLERLKGREAAIIIDASYSGATPGSIHRLEPLTQPIPKELYLCSSNAFGVNEAIELARSLQQLPPRLVVYGIEGMQFEGEDKLSAEAQGAVPEVLRQVWQDIAVFQGWDEGGGEGGDAA